MLSTILVDMGRPSAFGNERRVKESAAGGLGDADRNVIDALGSLPVPSVGASEMLRLENRPDCGAGSRGDVLSAGSMPVVGTESVSTPGMIGPSGTGLAVSRSALSAAFG